MKRRINEERVVLKFTDCQMEPLTIDLIGFSALFDELLGAKDKIQSQDYWDDDHVPLSGAITICFSSIIYCRYMYMRRNLFNKKEAITDCTVIHYELEKYLRVYIPIIDAKTLFRVYNDYHKGRNIIEEISLDHFMEFINSPEEDFNKYAMDVAVKIIKNSLDIGSICAKNFKIFALPLISVINGLPLPARQEQYEKIISMIIKYKSEYRFSINSCSDWNVVSKCIYQITNTKLLLLILRYIDRREDLLNYIDKIIEVI